MYEDSIKAFEKLDLQEFYCNHNHKPYIIEFNLPNNRVQAYQINGDLDFVEGLYHDKAVGIYSVSNDGGEIASNVKVMLKKDDIFKICKSFENDYINVNLENEFIQSITYKGFSWNYNLSIDSIIEEKLVVVNNKNSYKLQLEKNLIKIIGVILLLNKLDNKYSEIKIPLTVDYYSIKSSGIEMVTENYNFVINCRENYTPLIDFRIDKSF